MKRGSTFFKASLFVAVVLAVVLGLSGVALAWSEGSPPTSKTGTHDWIVSAAKTIANTNVPGSADWLNLDKALSYSHYPDEVYKDTNNHLYDVWGLIRIGNAPATVKSHYNAAVKALKAKNYATASKEIGIMAHYYDDVCNPWHSNYEFNTATAQAKYHDKYETDVLGHEPASVTPDGFQAVSDASTATKSVATFAHGYYSVLANSYTSGKGYAGANVDSTTKMLLGKAANGLADLLTSIYNAAK